MNAVRTQRGVGLIEILVAVVIIAIGFLAVARMQVNSMRYSQSAYYSSQAYFLASEMVDRMRANVGGVRAGAYDNRSTSASVADPGCTIGTCTPSGIADQDLYDWSRSLHVPADGSVPALLPSVPGVTAGGQIIRTADGRYTVRLTWGEIIDGEAKTSEFQIAFVAEN